MLPSTSPTTNRCSRLTMKLTMDKRFKWTKVLGIGNVDIVFPSRKKLTLTNVFHVPKMNRNLVSGDHLGKPRIKSVFESGKLIFSRNCVFVGKGYGQTMY